MPDADRNNPWQITPAHISWGDSGEPTSELFGDIYFSRGDGLAETQYVFLQQNRLEQRWRALDPHVSGVFTIGETGFGTGLNFFCAWELWRRVAPPSWRLLFISVERYPLARVNFQRAQQQWPQFSEMSAQVISSYPPLLPGFHHRRFSDRVELQLLFDDAATAFSQLHDSAAPELPNGFHIDAWFLDGFAPAKNPAMWSDELFLHIGRLSRRDSTFATFTVAGIVKRGMRQAGFVIEKITGFGAKRQMLRGDFDTLPPTAPTKLRAIEYSAYAPPAETQTRRVVIVGGGLAGAHTAHALATRGWPVTLLEQAATLAAGASGNPHGVLYTTLSPQAGLLNRFTLASYSHALDFYRTLPIDAENLGDFSGVLQLADSDTQWQQLRTAFSAQEDWVQFVDAEQASAIAQCAVPNAALWFSRAGWLAPAAICRYLAEHPLIEVKTHCTVQALTRESPYWQLETSSGALHADIVVIATANEATALLTSADLPLKPIRGQITELPASMLRTQPRCVICHEGYLVSAQTGITIGATFDQRDAYPQLRSDDHRANLRSLQRALPDLLMDSPDIIDCANLGGRVGQRCTTPDYLPLVGPVADDAAMRTRFGKLAKDANAALIEPGIYRENLYVNVGHGSRGLTSTPLCAELLAAQITGAARPLPRELIQALSPARFTLRNLVRNRGSEG
ncbi:MAG: bifunctional tRNA (5-methylaminomethyl-2-thiouridine)(34)-methyltransferase MnmD/FAD-dependent [Verrucomicrobiaceae bacterium]|nr:bifunctional tRNA (5-methylaminomethyl-2-thiouridine)(34)-methyltransferase MnmD/FAD-dependent [Verrucomicrobiaceae bacterium]